MLEEFRVFVYDDFVKARAGHPAIRVWNFETEEKALKVAKELCEKFNEEKDYMKNLCRYSVKVHRFHGFNLKFRTEHPLFNSLEEYK